MQTKIRNPNKYNKLLNLLCIFPLLGVLGMGISFTSSRTKEYRKDCPILNTNNTNIIYICEVKEIRQGSSNFNNSVELITHTNNLISALDTNSLLSKYLGNNSYQGNLSIYLYEDTRLNMWYIQKVKVSSSIKEITHKGKLTFTLHKQISRNNYLDLPGKFSSIKSKDNMKPGIYCLNYEVINNESINVIGFENTECSF